MKEPRAKLLELVSLRCAQRLHFNIPRFPVFRGMLDIDINPCITRKKRKKGKLFTWTFIFITFDISVQGFDGNCLKIFVPKLLARLISEKETLF